MEAQAIILCTLLVLGICMGLIYNQDKIIMSENKQYQGPVPEGYDLEHYRRTGETIK